MRHLLVCKSQHGFSFSALFGKLVGCNFKVVIFTHILPVLQNPLLNNLVSYSEAAIQGKSHHKRRFAVQDFADTSAPALMPIFQSAKGETLLLLVRSTPVLLQSMPRPYVTSMMVPLLVRAADQGKPPLPTPSLPPAPPSCPCSLLCCALCC